MIVRPQLTLNELGPLARAFAEVEPSAIYSLDQPNPHDLELRHGEAVCFRAIEEVATLYGVELPPVAE